MNRFELQQLAEIRLRDAKALLTTDENDSGAYYMAGYAVECALKAVIAKNQGVREYEFPDLIRRDDFYTHNPQTLLRTANLAGELVVRKAESNQFSDYWDTVVQWSEVSRYTEQTPRAQAEDLIVAISDLENGVLTWLKNYW